MEEKSIKYTHIKIILIFLVVLGHVTRMYSIDSVFKGYFIENYDLITRFIYGFHMPLFIMISGSIFSLCLNEKNKYSNKISFIKNKFMRLLIPYLFIGILILPFVLKVTNIITESYLSYVIKGILLGGNSRHLWYLSNLFFIFIIFICLPNKNKLSTFITFSLFASGIYMLKIQYISNLMYWAVFFYIGYLFNLYYYKINRIPKLILIILIVLYIFLSMSNINLKYLQIIGGIIFFLIFARIEIVNYLPYNVVDIIKKYSMGIYLFHPMLIYVIFYYCIDTVNPLILTIIAIIISYLMSIVISFILKKVKLAFLIGE